MHSRGIVVSASFDHSSIRGRAFGTVALCCLLLTTLRAETTEISDPERHGEWPSAAFSPNGDLWVAWTEYDGRGADEIKVRNRTGDDWQSPMTVSPRAGGLSQDGLGHPARWPRLGCMGRPGWGQLRSVCPQLARRAVGSYGTAHRRSAAGLSPPSRLRRQRSPLSGLAVLSHR